MSRKRLLWGCCLWMGVAGWVQAACLEHKGRVFCGAGECQEIGNRVYCAPHKQGQVVELEGRAYCGQGQCLIHQDRVYCSQFPGGGIIRIGLNVYTGPGDCVDYNGNAYCAKKPQGECVVTDGGVLRCEDGWWRDKADKAPLCSRAGLLE